jgi:hypothetical protein
MVQCKLCLRKTKQHETLCWRHKKRYVFDSKINGYRLKKTKNGTATRYIKGKYHSHEIQLIKILEHFYGPSNIVTEYHPLWALSKKGALLEFDIYIKNKNILIEYNGEQHYKFIKLFHKHLNKFKEQQQRDILKKKLAVLNGFSPIVIKYDEPLVEDYIIKKVESYNAKKEENA